MHTIYNTDCTSTVLQVKNKIISIYQNVKLYQIKFLRDYAHMHTYTSQTTRELIATILTLPNVNKVVKRKFENFSLKLFFLN